MRGYREPGLQDRAAAAKAAKDKALELLRNKAPLSEEEQAERLARSAAKEAAAQERREAMLREREAAKIAKREKAAAAAVKPVVLTEAERKAARDARYAARKARK